MRPDIQAKKIIKEINKNALFWRNRQREEILRLFRDCAKNVPAYADFLSKNSIRPEKIKSFGDLQAVPTVNKENYLKAYPPNELRRKTATERTVVFTSTSGSTGQPFYFPRDAKLDWQSSVIHEIILKNFSGNDSSPTLIIVGFGMGIWIGGLITYRAFEIAGRRNNFPISIITPGVNKKEILHILKFLAPNYKNVILSGYPPFIKDVLDEARDQKISLKKIGLKFLFAAETFTENFRDYITAQTGAADPLSSTCNIYGTADLGSLAFETPRSIFIRKLAAKNEGLHRQLFKHTHKLPTLAQYIPGFTNFEQVNDELVITGDSALPLVRYAIGDNGGVIDADRMDKILNAPATAGERFAATKARQSGGLPFVYVYERKNFAAKLHLRDIHPQIIKEVLLENGLVGIFSGKFTMITRYDKNNNQYLEINLELKSGKSAGAKIKKLAHKKLLNAICTKTTGPGDFQDLSKKTNLINLIFWPKEHPLYFKPGIKQQWHKNQ